MRYHVVVLVALMSAAVMLDSSDAWRIRIRFRRIWRAVKKPVCRWAVSKVCRVVGCTYAGPYGCIVAKYGCSWVTKKVCGKRRRRDLVEATLEKDDHLIPLPALFETYDLDGDERISVQEMAMTTGMDELETLNVAFPLCDTNDDGFLSHVEFINSPLTVADPEDIEMEHKDVAGEMDDSAENGSEESDTGDPDSAEDGEESDKEPKDTSAQSIEDSGENAADK